MDLGLADFAVDYAIKLGASYADARMESTSNSGFLLRNGVPQISGFDRVTGLGLRVIVNNTLGFVSINQIEKEKVRTLVERGMKVTKNAARIKEEIKLSDEEVHEDKYEVKQKINLEDASPAEKLSVLLEIEKAVESSGIKVPGSYLSLSDFTTQKYFVNSYGAKIESKIPRTDYFFFLTVKENGKSGQRYWQYGAAGGFETILDKDFPGLMLNEVKTTAKMLKDGVKPPKGKIDLVVGPQVTGIMVHESAGHPHEADRIFGREAAQAGESYLTKDNLGSAIGNEIVNISDDPTIEGSFGYYLYDDEGVRARKKALIKNGISNELLHNRETAEALRVKSNGSARATSYDREAIVRMSNTFLEEGDHKEEELIEGVKKGVYMKNFTEWNIDDRRVNQKYVGSEAYIIENGKITAPAFMPTIEIKTHDLWRAVDAIADNTEHSAGTCGKAEPMQAIPVWFGGPSFRMRGIRLSEYP
ncbi:TldD/PmbA family protein [Candidatus Woesearchaeota archaeon]|nr:TldD/PmbA family protein [Candidatus Woesearchaeota archaeon]